MDNRKDILTHFPYIESAVRKLQVRSLLKEINQLAENLGYHSQTKAQSISSLREALGDVSNAVQEKIAELEGDHKPRLATKASVRNPDKPLEGASEIVIDLPIQDDSSHYEEEVRFQHVKERFEDTYYLSHHKYQTIGNTIWDVGSSHIITVTSTSVRAITASATPIGGYSNVRGRGWNAVLEKLTTVSDSLKNPVQAETSSPVQASSM